MKNNKIFYIVIALGILVPAVFWLLGSIPDTKDTFGDFGFAWFACIATAVVAVELVIKGFATEGTKSYQRVYILGATIFGIASVLSLIGALAWPSGIIAPIITVVLAFAGVLLVLTSGKKWDKGDNHMDGYKNYHQRKEEKDKNI